LEVLHGKEPARLPAGRYAGREPRWGVHHGSRSALRTPGRWSSGRSRWSRAALYGDGHDRLPSGAPSRTARRRRGRRQGRV